MNDSFTIESHTGVLRCTKPLDREDVAQYTISISVRSSGTRHKRDVSGKITVSSGLINENR